MIIFLICRIRIQLNYLANLLFFFLHSPKKLGHQSFYFLVWTIPFLKFSRDTPFKLACTRLKQKKSSWGDSGWAFWLLHLRFSSVLLTRALQTILRANSFGVIAKQGFPRFIAGGYTPPRGYWGALTLNKVQLPCPHLQKTGLSSVSFFRQPPVLGESWLLTDHSQLFSMVR